MNLISLIGLLQVAAQPGPHELTARDELLQARLIVVLKPAEAAGEDEFALTERGEAFVDHILALPLPEPAQVWRMPGGAAIQAATPMLQPAPIAPARPPPPAFVTPTDPSERAALVSMLLNRGYGQNEISEQTGIPTHEVESVFMSGE